MRQKQSFSLFVLAFALGVPLVASAQDCTAQTSACLLTEAQSASEALRRSGERDEVLFAIISAKVKLGLFDEALAGAEEIAGFKVRAEAFGEIARGLGREGRFAEAIALALSIPDERQESVRVKSLEAIAAMMAAKGDVDAAFDAVVAIDNPFRRSEAQAVIATEVARAGDPDRAIRVATKIATDYWFREDRAQRQLISGVVSRAGDFDQSWFYEALSEIARVQAESGDSTAGVQTALAIPDAAFRSKALSHVGVLQAKAGDIDGAMKTASRIEAAYGDLEVLLAVTDAKAEAGDIDGAIQLGRRIADIYADYGGLTSVALRLAKQGQFDRALDMATHLGNPERRTQALTGIAVSLVEAGDLPRAITVAKMVVDPGDQAAALSKIAVQLAKMGQVEAALSVADDHADYADQGDIYVAVSVALARAGDLTRATETARRIDDEFFRALALAGIAPMVG